mgnify:CR=1 FL=1
MEAMYGIAEAARLAGGIHSIADTHADRVREGSR